MNNSASVIAKAYKMPSEATGFTCPAMYKTVNGNYGQNFKTDEVQQEVPTYAELVDSMRDFRKAEKLIKNKTVASQYSKEENLENMDEIQREKYKFDKNVIVPKKFPVQEGEYKYPEPSLNKGSVLYRTSYQDYGAKLPTALEIPNKYLPQDSEYTKSFPGNYRFNGLNTAKTFSKVHTALDEF